MRDNLVLDALGGAIKSDMQRRALLLPASGLPFADVAVDADKGTSHPSRRHQREPAADDAVVSHYVVEIVELQNWHSRGRHFESSLPFAPIFATFYVRRPLFQLTAPLS